MTAGAATPELLRPFGLKVPIVPAKGYSLTLKGEGVAPRHALYLCDTKVGVSGFVDGVRIAGIFELPGRDLEIDRRRVGYILDDTLPFLRGWQPAPGEVETRAGPASGQRRPTACRCWAPCRARAASTSPPVTACSASRSHPETGAAVADMVTSGDVPAWLEPMAPGRKF